MENNGTQKTNSEIKLEISKRIKSIRRSKRIITAENVAQKLEMTRAGYTKIENGKSHINAVTLWKLSVLFDCNIEEFFPVRPKGYTLTPNDIEEIKKIDERAVDWAENLFGKK